MELIRHTRRRRPRSAANRRQDEEAERVARSIINLYRQAQALRDVAATLVEAAESDKDAARAVHLIAVILTGTAWLEGLPALTTLASDAVKESERRYSKREADKEDPVESWR